MNEQVLNRFEKWQRTAWIVGVVGCILWLIGIVVARHTAFQSYWFAWIFWNGIGFGALSILMLHILSGGAWGNVVRPTIRAAIFTIPMMAVLMIPIFFSMGDVFPWATVHGLDQAMPHKRVFLTTPWFIVRAVIYFAILITLVRIFRVHAEVGDDRISRLASGAGICIYGICMLFACTDWIMSLRAAVVHHDAGRYYDGLAVPRRPGVFRDHRDRSGARGTSRHHQATSRLG
ncbi:hypothetical protein CfE428DRAFT_5769 [Chthoniobacter flavus Ellin428]|uniref:Uncharacterized protein n=1 Tax=Chthoniobacter flavus Ellin428 TaxID=497964 RepID=B4DA29_9BACT|nr:hypothetical protein [Chthoniobacter flavus]EDY16656.1 hypothetical protein CfE428DRAFT_5769 [Chthoniobacter flavus Ellin428]